ncbi:hypothetical protein [Moritella viscosa]|uniref:Uncharacterized protein n=1 Tax=Moritella viscosa TaxID=80854 RepID=A0A1L0CBA5_9GAMM|nr:hypothetical protein [Moritella viscosa]SGZ19207.1 Putative uncharacterized protein [Moritella viscosa]SHO14600.1 Putative uncharacterized protein [Moritella viscosa]SHO15442.1 Putative uncharacterized protein [Moritella viscosa]SHO17996.1 Putative uncharacterized protein [Moritella viscosa]SHO18927.1 Putative uncharacterized protein [Moritella viscosa]
MKKEIIRNPSFTPSPALRDHLNASERGVTGALNTLFDDAHQSEFKFNWLMLNALPENLENDAEFWTVMIDAWFASLIEFQEKYTLAADILEHFDEIDINKLPSNAQHAAIFCHESSQIEQWAILTVVERYFKHPQRNELPIIEIVRAIVER